MFSHLFLGSNDIDRSKRFYDATLGVLGCPPGILDPRGRLAYIHDGSVLLFTRPIDGQPATHAHGGTLGFVATSSEQIDAWHAAGVANGGTTCEDPPGIRADANRYNGYLRDPDGNKLCATYALPA